MSSNVFTLPELVDLALQTPEVGAVNFNILRIILHKILTECKLQNVTGEWEPVRQLAPVNQGLLLEEKLPDHPILERIAELKQRGKVESVKSEIQQVGKSEKEISAVSEDTDLETSTDVGSREKAAVLEPQTVAEKSDEDEIHQEDDLGKRERYLRTPVVAKSKKKSEIGKQSSAHDPEVSSGGMKHLWELKKLLKRIEAVEEELNLIIHTVDDLREWKEAKTERFRLLEGEIDSAYRGPTVGREEFEDTVIEIGEALGLVRLKQKEQKENWDAVNQDILKELELRATLEEMNQGKEELDKKLNTLSMAIRSMQEVIKDVIYPEACGTSKCVCCKRKAHLPASGMVLDSKKKLSPRSNNSKPSARRITKSPNELSFTTTCLKRLTGEDGMRKMFEDKTTETPKQDEDVKHSEQPVFTQHLIHLETFELPNLAMNFEALRPVPDTNRREYINLPNIRTKKVPVMISAGSN